MSKAFVEGFGFEMIAKRLEKVLNDYGFACEVVYLGEPKQIPVKTTAPGYSGSIPSHDGRSIAVCALPNSLVHAVLRYPHLVESEDVYARLTPEQAILALGYIDGTSVESDGNNAALNVNHLAYYLHKCRNTNITKFLTREDLVNLPDRVAVAGDVTVTMNVHGFDQVVLHGEDAMRAARALQQAPQPSEQADSLPNTPIRK